MVEVAQAPWARCGGAVAPGGAVCRHCGAGLAVLAVSALKGKSEEKPVERSAPVPAAPNEVSVEESVSAPIKLRALDSKEIAASLLPSTVSIRCSNTLGSGFFVGKGLVAT